MKLFDVILYITEMFVIVTIYDDKHNLMTQQRKKKLKRYT